MEEDSQLAKDPPVTPAVEQGEASAEVEEVGSSSQEKAAEDTQVTATEESHTALPTMAQLDAEVESQEASEKGTDSSAPEATDSGSICIKVKLIDGKSFELQQVPVTATVDELKTLIRAETDIQEENQRIIHHGKVLTSGQLSEHKLKDEGWIHVVFRDPAVRAAATAEENEQSEDTARQTPEEITTSLAAIISSAIRTSNRAPTAQPGGVPADAHPLQPREFNVEHLWQSLRTVDSLVNSFTELPAFSDREEYHEADGANGGSEIKEESVESLLKDEDFEVPVSSFPDEALGEEESKGEARESEKVPEIRRFETGQWVDVLDTVNQWLEATVMQVSEDGMKIKVHYNAWGERWDEVIDIRSHRIAPFRTKTKHRRTSENLSATPVSWVKNAPRIAEGNFQELLPRTLESVERSLAVFRQVVAEGNGERNVDGLLYLAPILDRTGRMLGDIASSLAQRPRLAPTKRTLAPWPFSALKQSILPFSLYIAEHDKNTTERESLLRARRLDSDFLQLVNQQPDNSARTGNLDIHIHAIVSPGQELGAAVGAEGTD